MRKTPQRGIRRARASRRVVHTTIGDLVAAAVDTVGLNAARELLSDRSPLQKVLRQRVVVE